MALEDELANEIGKEKIVPETLEIDAIAKKLHEAAAGHNTKTEDALEQVCGMIAALTNVARKERFIQSVSVIFNLKKKTVADQVKSIENKRKMEAKPIKEDRTGYTIKHSKIDEDKAYQMGFYEYVGTDANEMFDTGYWFRMEGGFVQVTNFVVRPLYHIYAQVKEENRRMIEANNGMYTRVVEMQSKDMMSIEGFCGTLYGQGNFLPKAGFGKPQLLKVLNEIGENFPMIYEMKKLGWQQEGMFAFFNKTFVPPTKLNEKGKLSDYDEYGVTIEKFGGKHLFSPAIGKGQELVRKGDDIYDNDKMLEWKQSPITFKEWADLFCKVYGNKAHMGIGWIFATLFRDVILRHNKIPHLYFYGPTGSGKSEIGESILNFFYSGLDDRGDLYKPFNLNQGTEYAFFAALESNTNTPFVGNEFDENKIDEERFRAIKAAHDGEGRMKGSGQKGRTMEQKIVRTMILLGQFLGTKDDNSVLNRSIPEAVQRIDNRQEADVIWHSKLKGYEKDGLSSLVCDVLELRPIFTKSYGEQFFKNQKRFQEKASANGLSIQSRILKNIACVFTCTELVNEHLVLPFAIDKFFEQCYMKMREMTMLVVKTSKVSEFWRMLEYCLDRGWIAERREFKVEEETTLTFTKGEDKKTEKWEFPRKILYLRLTTVYKLIEEKTPQQHRAELMSEDSFLLYAQEQNWFYGYISQKRFDKEPGGSFVTTCYAFDYEMLKVNLLRNDDDGLVEKRERRRIMGVVTGNAKEVQANNEQICFSVMVVLNEKDADGEPVTFEKYYKCYHTDKSAALQLLQGTLVTVLGLETVKRFKDNTLLQLDVLGWCLGHDKNFEKVPDEKGNIASKDNETPADDIPW